MKNVSVITMGEHWITEFLSGCYRVEDSRGMVVERFFIENGKYFAIYQNRAVSTIGEVIRGIVGR